MPNAKAFAKKYLFISETGASNTIKVSSEYIWEKPFGFREGQDLKLCVQLAPWICSVVVKGSLVVHFWLGEGGFFGSYFRKIALTFSGDAGFFFVPPPLPGAKISPWNYQKKKRSTWGPCDGQRSQTPKLLKHRGGICVKTPQNIDKMQKKKGSSLGLYSFLLKWIWKNFHFRQKYSSWNIICNK